MSRNAEPQVKERLNLNLEDFGRFNDPQTADSYVEISDDELFNEDYGEENAGA